MALFLQCIFSGLTVGAIYAVVAIGFTLIYAASDVVNFAQGEFVMLGGLATAFLATKGVPIALAAMIATVVAVSFGLILLKLAIERVADASPVTLIIITLGASTFIRGIAGLVFDKQFHGLPSFSGDNPIRVLGATVLPQSFWVLGSAILMFLLLWAFLDTRYDMGALLALKGFSAAIFGGLGNPLGAVVGGLLLGLLEALAAGYVTSSYKDGVAFVTLILVLLMMPNGLLGSEVSDRV